MPQAHPEINQLSDFALGRLEAAEVDAVESHLAGCETCCDMLRQMKEDTFVGLVRAAKHDGGDAGERASEAGELTAQDRSGASPSSDAPPVPPADAATLGSADLPPRSPAEEGATEGPLLTGSSIADIPTALAEHSRYRIVELLGTGGMGSVYRAEHRLMERHVALKVIHPKFVQSKQAVDRFHREVRAAARLQHPNIVHAYDAEQAGDLHFLVMEYVKGTDLGKVLEERGPLPVAEACEYIRQAALGLQHAHESGMVHRDIKPQNLMVSARSDRLQAVAGERPPEGGHYERGLIKILDFGLASLATEAIGDDDKATQPATIDSQKSGLTQAGSLMGTPDYMAPEQGRDAHTADIRSDIYSLGCTLYALLTGKVPFPGGTAIDKVIAHSTLQPPAIGELRKDVPAALVRILDKMMAKDPAERYQTPAEVAAALAPLSPLGRGAGGEGRSHRRRSLVAASAIAAGLLLVAAGIIFYWQTAEGIVRFEINDPEIKVVIDRDSLRITGADQQMLTLKSGNHRLTITRGDFEIDTTRFEIKRGGETRLKIEWIDSEKWMRVKQDDREIGRAELPKTGSVATTHPRDEDLLQGVWKLISVERAGQTIPMEVMKKSPLFTDYIIRGNDWGAVSPDEKNLQNSFKIIRRTDPKEIDVNCAIFEFWPDVRGIYKLEGDTFTVCVAEPGQPRPTEFTTKGDRDQIMIVARRATPADLGWVQLFNGKDLTGWKAPPMSDWSVENGMLVGRGIGNYLVNDREFSENFDLRCEAKISAEHFGLVKMRLDADETGYGIPIRGLYWARGVNKITISPGTPRPPVDVWFDYEINARGPDVKIKINGSVVAHLSGLTVRRGRLALETMSPRPPSGTIQFRKIHIKELPATPALPAPAPLATKIAAATKAAEASMKALVAREADPKADRDQLRADVVDFKWQHPGLPQALEAAQMLSRLPSPLDRLDPAEIAPAQRVEKLKELAAVLKGHEGKIHGVVALTFLPDGRHLASAGEDRTIRLWDLAGKSPVQTAVFKGHTGTIWSVACSPGGKRLASSSEDKTVRLWDVAAKGDKAPVVIDGYTFAITGLAFSPDGQTLASASWDPQRGGIVRLLDVSGPAWKERAVLTGHSGLVQGVAFAPDGRTLASGSLDGTVRVWDLTGTKSEPAILRHPDWVYPVMFSPDGKTLASVCKDGQLRLWDMTKEPPELRVELPSKGGHAYAPNGRLLFTGDQGGKVYVWDAALPRQSGFVGLGRGKKLGEWQLPGVTAITVAPDSRHVAVGGPDGLIHILRVSPPVLPGLKPPNNVGWMPLFNGKDLTGWRTHPDKTRDAWRVDKGVLIGSGAVSYLFSPRSDYENFHLRADFQINKAGNSGIYLRSPSPAPDDNQHAQGYEAQILGPEAAPSHYMTGGLINFTQAKGTRIDADTWYTLEVIVNGPHLVVKLNDVTFTDVQDPKNAHFRGHVALQLWDLGTVVKFRKIEIKELPAMP